MNQIPYIRIKVMLRVIFVVDCFFFYLIVVIEIQNVEEIN